jgi:biofilm PGA synthesis N-glycosyltransferase PgaC
VEANTTTTPLERPTHCSDSDVETHRLSYVLITSARNEDSFLEGTIKSVICQTVLPRKWIIVDDGSRDRTKEIVLKYSQRWPWIELLEMPPHDDHDYSAKARCLNVAFERVREAAFDIIANIDADISFDRDLFDFLLRKFAQFPGLGIAGAPMREANYDAVEDALFNETDVFGACQLFRRKCLEDIGGYTASKEGGIDWIAVRTARMKGWKTRSFLEKRFFHHRAMGTADCPGWRSIVNNGRKDYFLGNHPLWEVFRVFYQMTRRPFLIRGLLLFAGYSWACLAKVERPISVELLRFHRQEQLRRLQTLIRRLLLLQGLK